MKNYPAGKDFEIPQGGAVWKGETTQMSSFENKQLRIEMQIFTVVLTKIDSDVIFVYNCKVNINKYTSFALTRIDRSLVY